MDQKYTDSEKKIILKAMKNLFEESDEKLSSILKKAEKKENDSNQILEFTKEIKKQDENFRLNVVEVLWKIIYSDGVSDIYETNLMRRIVNLLYITDKQSGEIQVGKKCSVK